LGIWVNLKVKLEILLRFDVKFCEVERMELANFIKFAENIDEIIVVKSS